jgi:hypothetical protein
LIELKAANDILESGPSVVVMEPTVSDEVRNSFRAARWNVHSISRQNSLGHFRVIHAWIRNLSKGEELPQGYSISIRITLFNKKEKKRKS